MASKKNSHNQLKKIVKKKFDALPKKTKCIIGAAALVVLLLLVIFDEPLCGLMSNYYPSVSNDGSHATSGEMVVYYIDVGQGDSQLIVMPTGETMLIDAGPESSEDQLLAYLRRHGITKLTYALFTHTHEDHIGGGDAVLREFPTETVILSSEETGSGFFEDLLEAIDETGAEVLYASVGDTYTLGDAVFEVIGPHNTYYKDGNNYSIVGRLTYGNRAFLFTGDAEAYAEREMLAALPASAFSADVLKLGHHGSSTSTTKAFWDAVEPIYAVASCGKSNEYGHPHRETITAAEKRNVTLLRTDKNGTVCFYTNGKTLTYTCDTET